MLLGTLPTTLKVDGKDYPINTDYRVLLDIICAFNDPDLKDYEKAYVCLRLLFQDFSALPETAYGEAYKAAIDFLQCGKKPSEKKTPRTINWAKDEQMIFAAVNKVAGREVRAVDYLHWWTFLGYFDTVDRDDLFCYVIQLRQKLARHKKLEKSEQQFYDANRELVDLNEVIKSRRQDALDYIDDMFAEMDDREKNKS